MDLSTNSTATATATPTTTPASFDSVAKGWVDLSSGDTITGQLLNFVKAIATLARNLSDILSVINKYI
ncbi:hypothetical protein [Corynebacterium mayonis]|uniref:hypothetical protein n=1 Tax=Corynebacterium mayonis TaxID=3062461 RepID=UPI0031407BC3